MNKVYNVDCFELFEKMQDNSVDCVFTSPPYNSKRFSKYESFDDNYNDYFAFLKNFILQSLRVSKKYVIVNIQTNYYNKVDVYKIIGEFAKEIQRIVIWNKTNPAPSSLQHRLTNAYEFFIILSKKETVKCNSHFMRDVVTFPVNTKRVSGHFAIMNKNVCELFIREFTKENDIVFDPFMGSGTTAIVCKENKRQFIGSEIERDYYNIAIERIRGVKNEKYLQTSLF